MESYFRNKIYLITGANSGIGRQLAQRLANLGAKLFLIDKNENQMQLLKEAYFDNVMYKTFDLTDIDSIPELMNEAKENNIILDGFVHCAGISPLMTLAAFDYKMSLATYKINLFSFISLAHFFMDASYTKEGSSIVGISSNSSIYGGNRQYIYSSTKSAMNLFIKSTAKELASRRVRINAVLPSVTNTEMVAKLRTESEAIDMNVKYKQPFGILTPDDVCNAIIFLLSENSAAISGTTLKVNNGEVY